MSKHSKPEMPTAGPQTTPRDDHRQPQGRTPQSSECRQSYRDGSTDPVMRAYSEQMWGGKNG